MIYIISAILSIAMAAILYFRTNPELNIRQRLYFAGLRFVSLLIVCLFLLSPLIYFIKKYRETPAIILLKDNSASMQTIHINQSKSSALESSVQEISKAYKKAGYLVKETEFSDGLNGNKNSTYLLPALEKLGKSLNKSPITGIYLFSDGWFRDTNLNVLKTYDIPINVVADTTQNLKADLQILEIKHNRNGYRNELSLFETGIKSVGYNGTALVQFKIDNKVVKSKTISFQKESMQTITFENRFSQLGLHEIEVSVTSDKIKETTQSNNAYFSAIDILSDKEQILILSDAANWDNKFVLDTINENNRWQAQNIVIEGRDLYQGGKKITVPDLSRVSVIIIINQGTIQLDSKLTQNIISKVNQGCGLLFCGLPIAQLNDILPLKQSNIKSVYQGVFKLLPVSASYSVFQIPDNELSQIPPVDYQYVVSSRQAEVMAVMDNAQKSPAIAMDNSLGGKAVSFSFLNLWRWQMQSKSSGYKNFISDLIVWLSNKTSGQLVTNFQPSYFIGEPIKIQLSAMDEVHRLRQNLNPRISIVSNDNKAVFDDFMPLTDNGYSIEFKLDKPGSYRFDIKDSSLKQTANGRFVIQNQDMESRDLGYNIPQLSWISSQTHGKFTNLRSTNEIKPLKAVITDRTEKIEFPLYKKWYLISLFVLAFCFELFLRRRWGLL